MTTLEDMKHEPMVWIGIYIAVASFFCDIAMAADLVHGFRHKRLWFPSKYFTLNAASIAVLTVAMKLPVDLNNDPHWYMDRSTKLESLAFMCTMMANFMPSLAAMDNRTLLANIIGLSILIITIIVNIFISIFVIYSDATLDNSLSYFPILAYVNTAMMLLLLVIMIASSLIIPTSKEMLEAKYQTANKTFLTDQHLQHTQTLTRVEKLRQHVRRCWIMAETGSPQFVIATGPLSTASGVICVIAVIMNLHLVHHSPIFTLSTEEYDHIQSEYGESIILIFYTQAIGVFVGAFAPIFRSCCVLSFIFVSNGTHLKFLKVEKYWTQKLCEWKRSPVRFLSGTRSRTLVYNSKSVGINLCIKLQKILVILCKVISLIPTGIPIFFVYCLKPWKARLIAPSVVVTTSDDSTGDDLSSYVLKIHDELELAEKTLTRISNSMNSYILTAEKKQNKGLFELLEKSTGFKEKNLDFKGVANFDTDHVQPLLSVELVNSWSLPIVTLTCIAVALPNIRKDTIRSLIRSVGEGLSYTHQVEESLCCEKEYVNIRKATIILWNEVEHKCKWLDKALQKDEFRGKTAIEILKWFSNRAKETVTEINRRISGEMVENPPKELIAANSMYRITETILLRNESNREPITKKQLFALLSGMIADILCACFTNIPRVIMVKCNESVIEKREASVKAAAKLLGKATKIIERLDTCDLSGIDPDKMPYVDEWRLYLKQSIP